jgi:peroxiredoxin
MSNTEHEAPAEAAVPSYEQLLTEQYGTGPIERTRRKVQASEGLGNPATALRSGEFAPDFTLNDSQGNAVSLAALYAVGPVVVIFYRGGWCPFCNMYLRAFQLARTQLRALRTQVVLISPSVNGELSPEQEQSALLFPLLSDIGNHVARAYGLVFRMPAELRATYQAIGTDLTNINGDSSWELPMPATFVVDQAGRIAYAFVSADYTQRAEPAEVLSVLRQLIRQSGPITR